MAPLDRRRRYLAVGTRTESSSEHATKKRDHRGGNFRIPRAPIRVRGRKVMARERLLTAEGSCPLVRKVTREGTDLPSLLSPSRSLSSGLPSSALGQRGEGGGELPQQFRATADRI